MEINDAIYKHLSSYTGLAALVSNRIYPDVLPQDPTYPAISYQLVSESEVNTFQQPATLMSPVYQFNIWGATRASTMAVAKQLRLAFKNFTGLMGGANGVMVSGVVKVGRASDFETDKEGRIIGYKTMMDFEINYQEEV